MTQHEDHAPNGEETPADAQQAAGSEAHASGPAPHGAPAEHAGSGTPQGDDHLTVDDILGTEQSADVAGADEVDGENGAALSAADDPENPYLDDLRRITAEYANYRKRTEANAEVEKQRAKANAVMPLLGVLDDLDRAEAHGDLEEGSAFATIAQKVRSTLERLGLEGFGEKGEEFDPQIHEAIAQVPVPGTEQHTVLDVVERGYRIGDVELRPAKVAVAVAADG